MHGRTAGWTLAQSHTISSPCGNNFKSDYCQRFIWDPFFSFRFLLNIPVKKLSHVGTEPSLPGYYQYFFLEVNVSCSMIQHGDLIEDRTLDKIPESDALPLGNRACSYGMSMCLHIFRLFCFKPNTNLTCHR